MADRSTPPAPLTHGRVLKIAVPIVLSSATGPLLGAVDIGVVGQTGQAAPTGAVGLGATILLSVYWIFGFLRMGTTGMVGQAAGAGNWNEVSAFLSRALLIAVGAGTILILFEGPLLRTALAWAPASAEVEGLTATYAGIRIWSAPAAIAIYALTGWLIAMEQAGRVLVLQLVMNGINIALDLWFVLGLDLGVAGVAYATVIAEYSALGLGLWLCRAAFLRPAWRDPARVFSRTELVRMALVNIDILIRSAALLAIFTSFTFLSAQYGDVDLAANQVLLQFLSISAFALDGFAYAAETLVARCVGRKDRARLRRAAYLCTLWGGMSAGLMAVCFALLGPFVIDLMTTAAPVRESARSLLGFVILSPLLAVWAFMLDGIFLGATRGRDLRNMMVLSLLVYAVAVAVLMPAYGNVGLWMALMISFVARSVSLAACYPGLERAVNPAAPEHPLAGGQ